MCFVQQEQLVEAITKAITEATSHAHDQEGWTGEGLVLILAALVIAAGFIGVWFVRMTQTTLEAQRKDLSELKTWQQNVVADQLRATTSALEGGAQKLSSFSGRLDANKDAVDANTDAVRHLSNAIANAPCGRLASDGAA